MILNGFYIKTKIYNRIWKQLSNYTLKNYLPQSRWLLLNNPLDLVSGIIWQNSLCFLRTIVKQWDSGLLLVASYLQAVLLFFFFFFYSGWLLLTCFLMKKHMQMWLLPRQTHGLSKMKRCVIFVFKKIFVKIWLLHGMGWYLKD